jgi:predicted benzoate:H+ symporter BenE
VSLLRGFARFWYDFVIGDDWKIAAAVAAVLLAGAVLVAAAALPQGAIAALIGVALLGAFSVVMAIDVRRR